MVLKLFNNRKQRELLKEHFNVFSDLGNIVEYATLINQTFENKNRNNIKLWSYYYDDLMIDKEKIKLVFDVRSMEDGQDQYRVQRLEKYKKTDDYDGGKSALPPYSQPVFSTDNIPQSNIKVNSSTSSDSVKMFWNFHKKRKNSWYNTNIIQK